MSQGFTPVVWIKQVPPAQEMVLESDAMTDRTCEMDLQTQT